MKFLVAKSDYCPIKLQHRGRNSFRHPTRPVHPSTCSASRLYLLHPCDISQSKNNYRQIKLETPNSNRWYPKAPQFHARHGSTRDATAAQHTSHKHRPTRPRCQPHRSRAGSGSRPPKLPRASSFTLPRSSGRVRTPDRTHPHAGKKYTNIRHTRSRHASSSWVAPGS